ncbi:unnamed protein product, partial [Didymodactylos carnosus]
IRTEPDFIERTQQLCEKILESAKSSYGRSGDTFSNPPKWLRTAVTIFDTLQKFPDLTYFKDINERRQDDQIRKYIGDLISNRLSATYRENMIKDTCELTENEIRKNFQAQFDVHQNDFDNDLENIFKFTNASERIRERCRQFLKRQVTEICNVWCTAAIQTHDKKQMKRLVRDGSDDLRHLIEDIIKSGKTMTKEKAKQEFENMWEKKITSIESNFKAEERLKQAIKFVYGNYNIFEKESLPSHQVVISQLEFIHELSEKQDLKDVIVSIQNSSADNVSRSREGALEHSRQKSDATAVYTFATLHNFKYLYKERLTNYYTTGTMNQQTSMMQESGVHQPHEQSHQKETSKSNSMKRHVSTVANHLGFAPWSKTSTESSTTTNPISLRFDFIKTVHNRIWTEMTDDPNAKSNILNIPELFCKIIDDTTAIVHGHDTVHRPIEVDLVQKIVGFINTYINEINQELLVFNLLLSKQIKSSIHISILILLTIIYYDEQKNHFRLQLSILDKEKDSLLTYFISMVVPDAECDQIGAENLVNKIRNTIQSNLMRDGQKILLRIIETLQILNRKHIQRLCDGKLLAAASDDEWLFRYIVAPNEIIEEEFKILWKAVEETINQQLAREKSQ